MFQTLKLKCSSISLPPLRQKFVREVVVVRRRLLRETNLFQLFTHPHTTMAEQRLSDLALLSIHMYRAKMNLDAVVHKFVQKISQLQNFNDLG